MIDHRRCNKYVGQRVSGKPDLIRYSHSLSREANRLAYLMNLPYRQSTGPYLSRNCRGVTAAMRRVPCNVKLRRLTPIPLAIAPDAPTMESYGKNVEVNPWL